MKKSWCLIVDTYEYIKEKREDPDTKPYFFYDFCYMLSLISLLCFLNIFPIVKLLIHVV